MMNANVQQLVTNAALTQATHAVRPEKEIEEVELGEEGGEEEEPQPSKEQIWISLSALSSLLWIVKLLVLQEEDLQ